MLVQSKTLVDAAKKAGVQHIVHLGTFGQWDTSVPHFLWHRLVETYIEASGIAWTHLKPNMFMDMLAGPLFVSGPGIIDHFGGQRVGWVAADTIAQVAATVLREGPTKHRGKSYFMSTEVLTGREMADILTEALGRTVTLRSSDDLAKTVNSMDSGSVWFDAEYAKSGTIIMKQIKEGQMGYIGTVRDDGPYVTGKVSMKLREWVVQNKSEFVKLLS